MTPRIYFLLMFIVIFSLFTVCVQSEVISRNYTYQVTSHKLDDPFVISKGDIAVIENGMFRVMVDEFMEDYRCPVNAECVWAGQARVRVNVNGELVVLTLGELFESDQNAADLGSVLSLKLLDITPYPGSEEDEGNTRPSVQMVVVHW